MHLKSTWAWHIHILTCKHGRCCADVSTHVHVRARTSRHTGGWANTKSKRQLLLSMSHNKCTDICTLTPSVTFLPHFCCRQKKLHLFFFFQLFQPPISPVYRILFYPLNQTFFRPDFFLHYYEQQGCSSFTKRLPCLGWANHALHGGEKWPSVN